MIKKLSLILAYCLVSTISFPCSGTWNACGSSDIQAMGNDVIRNCSPGSSLTIIDLCDGNHIYRIRVGQI